MKKVLFLDIDGVCNSKHTIERSHRGVIGIDPYMAFLVGKIQLDTGCEVVLSSSWRHMKEGREEIEKAVVPIIDITPSCCQGIRGVEIYTWIQKNFTYEEQKELRYAILDDESDMLLWQKDKFFQTSWETGLTPKIADAVTKHLNGVDTLTEG